MVVVVVLLLKYLYIYRGDDWSTCMLVDLMAVLFFETSAVALGDEALAASVRRHFNDVIADEALRVTLVEDFIQECVCIWHIKTNVRQNSK